MTSYSELRKTDYKGRLTIPSRMLDSLGIECGDEVRIIFTNDHIEIRPFEKDYEEVSERLMSSIQELNIIISELRDTLSDLEK